MAARCEKSLSHSNLFHSLGACIFSAGSFCLGVINLSREDQQQQQQQRARRRRDGQELTIYNKKVVVSPRAQQQHKEKRSPGAHLALFLTNTTMSPSGAELGDSAR